LADHLTELIEELEADPLEASVACLFTCAVLSRPLTREQRSEVQRAIGILELSIGGGPGPVAASSYPS
jgi:hypothetical protein